MKKALANWDEADELLQEKIDEVKEKTDYIRSSITRNTTNTISQQKNVIYVKDKTVTIEYFLTLTLEANTWVEIGTVPAEYAPVKQMRCAGISGSGVPLAVNISTNGSIQIYSQTAITSGTWHGFTVTYVLLK